MLPRRLSNFKSMPDYLNYQSRSFESSRDLTIKRPIRCWNGTLVYCSHRCSFVEHNKALTAMMTSWNGNILCVTGPLWGEFTGHKGQWRRGLVFYLICAWINGWLKQWWGCWFETPSRPLWRHCNYLVSFRQSQLYAPVRGVLHITVYSVDYMCNQQI